MIVFGLGFLLTILARRRALLAGSTALIVMTADLAAANSRYVLTVPQAVFESKPEVVKVIEEAERTDPSPGPFRIHRMRYWHPSSWVENRSKNRFIEVASWERDTLLPKYAIDYGLEYTRTQGVAELDDYERFFASFYLRIRDTQVAQSLGVEVGDAVLYYSRRAYDMWNTRYVIVPFDANGWRDPQRGSAPFLFQSEQVYPDPAGFIGPDGIEQARTWAGARDFRVLRNLVEYPRSWVVHDARADNPHHRTFPGAPEQNHAGNPLCRRRDLERRDSSAFMTRTASPGWRVTT